MQEIKSLDELVAMIQDPSRNLYIRYTTDVRGDIKRGYSHNYAANSDECGLSVNNVASDHADVLGRNRETVAMQVSDYSFYARANGARAYILTGTEVGRGSDGEPLIADAQVVAVLSAECIAEARCTERERTERAAQRRWIR